MTKEDLEISDEDIRAARREIKSYLDITDDDLKRIYEIALRHARERLSRRIQVREVMTKEVTTIGPEAGIEEAARLITENDVSGLPVVEGEKVVGVVTEADVLAMTGIRRDFTFRDLIGHLTGEPIRPPEQACTVRDVMSSPAIVVRPETDITEAARLLKEKRIKRLPVVDEKGRLVGIVSRRDVIQAVGAL